MFLGSRFCSHCGEKAKSIEVLSEDAGNCPRCKRPLESLQIEATQMRECMRCGGIWTDAGTFESICADKEQQSAVLSFIHAQTFESQADAPISYVPCPECKQLMNRSNFARSSGVIIDLCKQHGVWFDADELPRIIEFIDKGGLAKARAKEKMAIEDERSKLCDEQRKLAMMELRAGRRGLDPSVENSGFGGVISALFDL